MARDSGEADVIVVGARAAGAAVAMLLSRAGLTVTLLDHGKGGTDTLSTHALMRGGVAQLSRWGLLDQVIAAGTPAIRETTFRYSSSDVTIAIKPWAGVDALYAPRRTVLDPILVGAARAAGVHVRYGTGVIDLCREHGRVVGVVTRDRSRGITPLRARLVVGADGRRSTIARLVAAPITHRAAHTSASVYGYFSDLDTTGYEWAYRPGAAAGLIPTNDGLTCVFGTDQPERIGRGGPAVLDAVVAASSPDIADRLRSARLTSPLRTFTGQPGHLRRPWGPGWALVGDAGSWKDPISAHGLTDAMRDAELLAQAIVGTLTTGKDEAEAGRTYELTRNRLTVPMLRDSAEIAAMRWDDVRIVELLRRLNDEMSEEVLAIQAFDEIGHRTNLDAGAGRMRAAPPPQPVRHVHGRASRSGMRGLVIPSRPEDT